MRNFVLWKTHGQLLIGSSAEATKLALEIDDIIERLFNPVSLRILSKIYGLYATRRHGRALRDKFGGLELYSIGSTEI